MVCTYCKPPFQLYLLFNCTFFQLYLLSIVPSFQLYLFLNCTSFSTVPPCRLYLLFNCTPFQLYTSFSMVLLFKCTFFSIVPSFLLYCLFRIARLRSGGGSTTGSLRSGYIPGRMTPRSTNSCLIWTVQQCRPCSKCRKPAARLNSDSGSRMGPGRFSNWWGEMTHFDVNPP